MRIGHVFPRLEKYRVARLHHMPDFMRPTRHVRYICLELPRAWCGAVQQIPCFFWGHSLHPQRRTLRENPAIFPSGHGLLREVDQVLGFHFTLGTAPLSATMVPNGASL